MNFSVFLKVFGDLCLYFGCIGALPALFPHNVFFLWPCLICGFCGAFAAFLSDGGRSTNRYLYAALSLICLLFGQTAMEWLLLIPPVVYTLVLILRDQWDLEYFHFTASFRRILVIFGIAVMLVHFGVLIESRSDFTRVLDSVSLLRHYLIYAVCGILLQRQLRLGNESSGGRYLNNLQLALMTGGTASLVLSIALAEKHLSSRGISLWQLLGQAIKYLLSIPLAALNYLFVLLSELQSEKMDRFKEEHYSDIEATPKMPMEEMQQLIEQTPQEEAAFPWWLAVLLLIVFTCILVLLVRSLGNHRKEPAANETVAILQPKAKEKQPPRRSNRSKVRRLYREFLKAEKRMGHKLHSHQTSQDILDTLVSENKSEAEVLRKLYLSARYDLHADVTAQQVQRAKDALKGFRKE